MRLIALLAFLTAAESVLAQNTNGGSNLVVYVLVVVGVILVLGVVMQVSDNLIQIEAQKRNVQETGMGLFPRFQGLFRRSLPKHLQDKEVHLLNKGFNIMLEGAAEGEIQDASGVTRYALQPPNWRGIAPIPKLVVEVGDSVKAGQALFYDKQNSDIQFVAPVSGEVIAVNRGAKRAITEVVILGDKEMQYEQFEAPDVNSASREEIVDFLVKSGGWSLIVERPFDVIADREIVPSNIFVSTFDSAPNGPDLNLVIDGREDDFQAGINALAKLTHGKVHLGLDARGDNQPAQIYANCENAEKHYFRGAHPCGNVGVQIHHIAPIDAGHKVWTLDVQSVMTLGALFSRGQFDGRRVIALTGDRVEDNKYVRTYFGANIGELFKGNVVEENSRIISGDVLSGETKSFDGYVNVHDDQISAIAEGDHYELFGWLVPSKARPSISNTYPNFLFPNMKFSPDTNTHGEKRAFVVTGQYEKMLPMDIFPQHLMKAIMVKDFERMEGLGIYELTEEDLALCEFACTSKMPLQEILREGLDLMREQS